MARVSTRISTSGRTRLEDVVPIATPFLVFIDPSNACNLRCSFCPTGDFDLLAKVGRKTVIMEFPVFAKIIKQFRQFPEQVKTLRLYKDGEPLLNPAFPKMVAYAKNSGRFMSIDTTTNGLLLSPQKNKELAASGLDKIFISVPTGYTKSYLGNVADLHANSSIEIFVKIVSDGLSPERTDRFINDFSGVCDTYAIEHLAPCWPGYEVGNVNHVVGIYGQPLSAEPQKVCPYLFYSMAINSDGSYSLCFLDWAHEVFLGHVLQLNVVDFWNGDGLFFYRIAHLVGGKKHLKSLCSSCQQLVYGMPDNIDRHAGKILDKLFNPRKEKGANNGTGRIGEGR